MGGSQKSKRVSWASDVNLCQVRLFLSDDSPSQVGAGSQDHLQAKALWAAQSGGMGSDENLPPGFEGLQPASMWRVKLSQIPLVKWKCPARLEINSAWQVVAGEESMEAETQNQRELRVLEAIYPRPSAIPPNPSLLEGVEDTIYNDERTPVVPITPIEDEDAAFEGPSMIPPPQNTSFSSEGRNGISGAGVGPDIVAAAQAALSSVMSNTDPTNLIDRDLLFKILSDPNMVEQLVSNHGGSSSSQNAPASTTQITPPSTSFHTPPVVGSQNMTPLPTSSIPQTRPPIGIQHNVPSTSSQNMPSTSSLYAPNLRPPPKNSFDPVSMPMNRRDPAPTHVSRPELVTPPMSTSSGPFYPLNRVGGGPMPNLRPDVMPPSALPVKKDINYYKSLIQQHGGEKRDNLPQFAHQGNQPVVTGQEYVNMGKPREQKAKIMKPCIYFNSSRGCRNGANCAYQHDSTSSQQRVTGIPEVQNAKRVKLDREIPGS